MPIGFEPYGPPISWTHERTRPFERGIGDALAVLFRAFRASLKCTLDVGTGGGRTSAASRLVALPSRSERVVCLTWLPSLLRLTILASWAVDHGLATDFTCSEDIDDWSFAQVLPDSRRRDVQVVPGFVASGLSNEVMSACAGSRQTRRTAALGCR